MFNIKSFIKALSICFVVTSLVGCTKYLEQVPENSLTRDEFFKTEADANSALIGVYDALQAANSQFLRWSEFRGDLISNDVDAVYLQQLDNTSSISNWTDAYRLIGRANIVIEKVPEIPALDSRFTEQESNAIVGEALFLRSLSYFYLVRAFKEVPLVLEAPSSDAVDFLVPKSTSDVIFDQIEKDLAIAEAAVPAEYGRTFDNKGRVTKGAVHAMQTDVYLWRKKYSEAAAAAKKVIESGLYSLVPGDKWFTIFSEKNSSESIFEIQYDAQLSEVNSLRGLSNANLVNNVLYNYFKEESDIVRGENNTYREAGARQFWKYTGLTTNNVDRASNDPNYIVYRLPDVMLMRAEALIHLGDNERVEAGVLINKVRARAGIDTLDFLAANTPVDIFNQVILKERAMELAMEGKRWFDLVRFATNENQPEILIGRVVPSRLVANRAQVRSRIIDVRSWYLPILRDELAKNPNLTQNPYYR